MLSHPDAFAAIMCGGMVWLGIVAYTIHCNVLKQTNLAFAIARKEHGGDGFVQRALEGRV